MAISHHTYGVPFERPDGVTDELYPDYGCFSGTRAQLTTAGICTDEHFDLPTDEDGGIELPRLQGARAGFIIRLKDSRFEVTLYGAPYDELASQLPPRSSPAH